MSRYLFFCTILCVFLVGCPKNGQIRIDSDKNLRPHSRELKILIDPNSFVDREAGFREFWELVKEVAEEHGIKTQTAYQAFKPKRQQVIFLDTDDFSVRKTGYILRKRVKYKKKNKKLGKKMEFALKFRSDDVVKSAESNTYSTDYGAKLGFEEDMGYSAESEDNFKRKYSKRSKIKTRDNPGTTIKDFAEIFPILGEIGIPVETVLKPVNGTLIDEWKVSPGHFDFGEGLIAESDITIWYDEDGNPLVGEFSFDHKIKDFDNQVQPATHKMFTFFMALRERLGDRVSKETTKTGFTYGRKK